MYTNDYYYLTRAWTHDIWSMCPTLVPMSELSNIARMLQNLFIGIGYERHLLSPQLISMASGTFPSLNDTCALASDEKDLYANIRRSGK